MDLLNNFTLIGLPYAALVLFVVGSIYRYQSTKYTYSSLSSQFLEGKQLFWGSMPFHWGLLVLFLGHLIAFLMPESLLAFNSHPVRLLIIEISAFMFALIVLVGILTLFVRRITNPRLQVVTTRMDLIVEILLILEVIIGIDPDGNLNAIAPRGSFPDTPRSENKRRSSILITMPSASKGRSSLLVSHSSVKAIADEMLSNLLAVLVTGNPKDWRYSRVSH